ncbi:G-protein alpha-subunit, partial [Mycena olivaceomarginata]
SMTGIIFCMMLSECGQVLEEERGNQMRESLCLFESIINLRWFLCTSVILCLNKIDVSKRELPKVPLGRYFPEYEGGNNVQKAVKYMFRRCMLMNHTRLMIYPHVTQATNTSNIWLVFAAIIRVNIIKSTSII